MTMPAMPRPSPPTSGRRDLAAVRSSASGVPGRRVVVLDDDPTGTQCVADVVVALDPRREALKAFEDQALYVLTNTRSLSDAQTRSVVAGVRDEFLARQDLPPLFVARGDSTLRGRVAAEMQTLGLSTGVGLVVPAYPAAGRITRGGVQWLEQNGQWVNVADTEFAKDPVFGFSARSLTEWLVELDVTTQVVPMSVGPPDGDGCSRITEELLAAPDGAVVVPDVTREEHIEVVRQGLVAALDAGRHVVIRCAAPLAASLAGRPGRMLPRGTVRARRLLVVCGSHTRAATEQLQRLMSKGVAVRSIPTVPTGADDELDGIAAVLCSDLDSRGIAAIATERDRRPEHDGLLDGAGVMNRLTAVVARLAPSVDAMVTKGGITSADVAAVGLRGSHAICRGQIDIGISLFEVSTPSGIIWQAVVPGNVGSADAIQSTCRFMSGN